MVCSGIYEHRLPLVGTTVGAARQRLAARLDIHPHAAAVVDGRDVGDDHVLAADEVVTFVHRAGEKGSRVVVEGDRAAAFHREGLRSELPVPELVRALRQTTMSRVGTPLAMPPGVPLLDVGRTSLVVVHETPPRIWSLTWIRSDSLAQHGAGATFRQVRVALPYVVMLLAFVRVSDDAWSMSPTCGVYFRTLPVSSPDDTLMYPALLNCMTFEGLASTLCTQGLDSAATTPQRGALALTQGITAMYQHLFASKFNLHPEAGGRDSCFTLTTRLSRDPGLRSIEAWESATERDRSFALGAGWLPMATRLGDMMGVLRDKVVPRAVAIDTAVQLADLVARHGRLVREGNAPEPAAPAGALANRGAAAGGNP